MIKILNICLHQNLVVIKFFKILKIRELFLFLFYDVQKENMFTINLEDGREAPSKASTLDFYKVCLPTGPTDVCVPCRFADVNN